MIFITLSYLPFSTLFRWRCTYLLKDLQKWVGFFLFLWTFRSKVFLIIYFKSLISVLVVLINIIFQVINFGFRTSKKFLLSQSFFPFLLQKLLIRIYTNDKLSCSFCYWLSHIHPLKLGKFEYFKLIRIVIVTNRRFNSVCILDSKILKHWCSGSFLLFLDNAKRTTVKSKRVRYFFDQSGKNSTFVIIWLRDTINRPIKKSILLSWMSMKIKKKSDLMIIMYFLGNLFY